MLKKSLEIIVMSSQLELCVSIIFITLEKISQNEIEKNINLSL